MEGDVRSSSDEISDSSVDNTDKTAPLQQNGSTKKHATEENGKHAASTKEPVRPDSGQ